MRRFSFPVAVALTSVALVVVIGVIGAVAVQSALASAPWMGRAGFGPQGFGGPGFDLPPELQGLGDLPPAERFDHFVGVQVSLKDKDNQPLTVNIIPGTTTAASADSLSIAGNDGSARTFTLNESTAIRGKPAQADAQAGQPSLATGDKVIVVTLNNDTTARAVINGGTDGFGAGGFGGPRGWGRPGFPHW